MIDAFSKFFSRKAPPTVRPTLVVISDAALASLKPALNAKVLARHEGIVYLIGTTDGTSTVITGVVAPIATTTRGSFKVSAVAMAKVMRFAADSGLQVVGQLHTHPQDAFHSAGDISGTHIHYPGFVSVVIPNYGKHLPSLVDAHVMHFTADSGWKEYSASKLVVARSFCP